MENLKRMWFELMLMIIITAIYLTRVYEVLPGATQLNLLKVVLVNMGLSHAHVFGKMVFNVKVDWNVKLKDATMAHWVRSALYVSIPFCYALGG